MLPNLLGASCISSKLATSSSFPAAQAGATPRRSQKKASPLSSKTSTPRSGPSSSSMLTWPRKPEECPKSTSSLSSFLSLLWNSALPTPPPTLPPTNNPCSQISKTSASSISPTTTPPSSTRPASPQP